MGDDIVDSVKSYKEHIPERNPFTNNEADEVSENPTDNGEVSDEVVSGVVALYTEDEANAIEDLEYIIFFEICFSEDEVMNNLTKRKRFHVKNG